MPVLDIPSCLEMKPYFWEDAFIHIKGWKLCTTYDERLCL